MDHLPRPKNPILSLPRVPYLGTEFPHLEYDGQGLEGFVERCGYTLAQLAETKSEYEELLSSLCVLQSWAFVGFCIEFFRVFGIQVGKADLLHHEEESPMSTSRTTISTEKMNEFLVMLEARTRGEDDDCGDDDDELAECFLIIDRYCEIISEAILEIDFDDIRENEELIRGRSPVNTDLIHLSMILMAETLEIGANMLNGYRIPDLGIGRWLKEQLLAAGWCRSEAFSLLDQEGTNKATILYLCQMDRYSLGRTSEHRLCGDSFRCVRENLDHSVYKTKHIADCLEHDCKAVIVDSINSGDVSNIVLSGNTPLITVSVEHSEPSNASVRIQSTSSSHEKSKVQYVCISHVWSDGLGNLHQNSIPMCQALRIQKLVNDMFPDEMHPVPFWLDTLCVPLRRPARDEAIKAMRTTYTNAAKVLVLDAVLQQASISDIDITEAAMRIRTSTWGRRLWTFHESCLAQSLHYQFADRAITCEWLEQHQSEDSLALPRKYDVLHKPTSLPKFAIKRRLASINRTLENSILWIKSQERAFKFDPNHSTTDLTNCLRYRWTSRLADETICLAGILGHGLENVLEYEDEENRMIAFILSFDQLPSDILFINRPRIIREGYGWVPRTFLGGDHQTISLALPGSAHPTTTGLEISTEGMTIENVHYGASQRIVGIEYRSQLYYMSPQNAGDAFTSDTGRSAILLRHWLRPDSAQPPGVTYGKAPGVFCTIVNEKEDLLIVRFEFTVDIEQNDSMDGPTMFWPTTPRSSQQRWLIA